MSNPKHDRGEHFLLTPKAEPFLERMIFNNRFIILLTFLFLTLFLGYNAVQIKPDASLERMIPLKHPYIVNMMERRDDLQNLGNFIRIAVSVKEGDVFDKQFLETLRQMNDDVFYLSGVDRSGLRSIWTSNVRWVEVTEEGFQGGTVIPDGYDGSPASLEALRQNLLRSGEVGRLVADDFKSAILYAPLYEVDPETGKKLDYHALSKALEETIREKYQAQDKNVQVHIVGFAKKVGDLIEGVSSVALFALITILSTTVLLTVYSRCLVGTLVPVFTSIVAVFWQLGIMRLLGYGMDPYSVLVPFLVFAIGISHGVQIVNMVAIETAKGFDSITAARLAFRALYIPGMLALVSDAIGFTTLLFIEIDVIKDLAVGASIGVAVIIVTNLVLHPLIVSYVGISKSGVAHVRKIEASPAKAWRLLSYFAHPSVAPISLLIAILGMFIGMHYQKDVKIGDLDAGAPEFWPDSRYNKDNKFIIDNYSTSADILVVMVDTPPEKCSDYRVMDAMDRLEWTLRNTPGVQSTASLSTVSKLVTKALSEGNLKWSELSRNQTIINSSIQRAPSGMVNTNCSLSPVLAFLQDHKAETLQRVVVVVKEFADKHNTDDMKFLLAAGNGGIDAATNEVISNVKNTMLFFVYAVVSVLCLITFRSVRAVLCIITPLVLTSVLCEALMAIMGIGIKVETLPVIALGVGIGVDYGIYIYSRFEQELLSGKPLQDAYFETLRTTGKAVSFTGITLAIGVCTWAFSPIKFQANMGFLLFFMFLWNMFGALWLLPALARFLLRPEKMVEKARLAKSN